MEMARPLRPWHRTRHAEWRRLARYACLYALFLPTDIAGAPHLPVRHDTVAFLIHYQPGRWGMERWLARGMIQILYGLRIHVLPRDRAKG